MIVLGLVMNHILKSVLIFLAILLFIPQTSFAHSYPAKVGEKLSTGVIAVDAIFSPIKKVNFTVENIRVGQRTDYNKVIIGIENKDTQCMKYHVFKLSNKSKPASGSSISRVTYTWEDGEKQEFINPTMPLKSNKRWSRGN